MFLATSDILGWAIPIVLGLGAGWLIARGRNNSHNDSVIVLNPDDFNKNMRKGQLIDMRPEEDWKKSKINGSRNFPKRSLGQQMYKVRSDLPVFLYQEKGYAQAKSLANKLARKGFNPIYVLKCGYEEWPYQKKES